ncbi:MAG: DedA family protein [Nanoarchaeota archaeon]
MNWFLELINLILHLDNHLIWLFNEYGLWVYLLVFLIILCETGLVIAPFLPGDSLLFTLGAFAATGALNIWLLIILLGIAAILGDTLNYWIGHHMGRKVFSKKIRFINKEHLRYTEEFYEKHGAKTIILARFLPIVRTFAPFVAGVGKMKYKQFIAYNIIGGITWVLSLTLGGYFFGQIPWVKENFSKVVLAIIILSTLPLIWELIYHKFLHKAKPLRK